MVTFIIEHLAEIFFGLLSAGALALCKYFHSKYKKLSQYTAEEANRKQRQMILDEIEPIIRDLTEIHAEIEHNKQEAEAEIERNRQETEKEINELRHEEELIHQQMYQDLEKIQDGNEKNFKLILNSYKFRLIQLCKTHLHDGFISSTDFEQLTEMYKLYTGMGGNGQAKEYYDKVMDLEVRD